MEISLLRVVIAIVLAGGVGGLLNALIADGGFKREFTETLPNGQRIWRPGWLGNVFVGMVAALVIWALYGVLEVSDARELLRQAAGAVLTGIGGGRVLTNEADKRILLATKNELADALKAEQEKGT